MVTDSHLGHLRPDDCTDDGPAAPGDYHASPQHIDDAPRPTGDPERRLSDSTRVAASRGPHGLPATSESNYPAPTSANTVAARDRLRIELPRDAPVLTPAAARALLRVILAAADRQQITTGPPQPPRRTP
jgi:hypothetical protein